MSPQPTAHGHLRRSRSWFLNLQYEKNKLCPIVFIFAAIVHNRERGLLINFQLPSTRPFEDIASVHLKYTGPSGKVCEVDKGG